LPRSDSPNVVISNLATLSQEQGVYAEAEVLYQRALAIYEKALGHIHPHVARTMNDMAELFSVQGRYAEAEPLFQQAIRINEKRWATTIQEWQSA
jgi:tetratricopeptide (TPR) repeat protein